MSGPAERAPRLVPTRRGRSTLVLLVAFTACCLFAVGFAGQLPGGPRPGSATTVADAASPSRSAGSSGSSNPSGPDRTDGADGGDDGAAPGPARPSALADVLPDNVSVSRAGLVGASAGSSSSGLTDGLPEGRAISSEGDGGLDASGENRQAGADAWRIVGRPKGTRVEGFADTVSALAGEKVDLYVSSTGATFTAEVLRTGWYDGALARTVWTSPAVPGGVQTATTKDPATRMVSATWKRSLTLDTTGWVPGAYLVKLRGSDGAQGYVPLTIRTRTSNGAVLLVNSVLTWQAYNTWGGASTYKATAPGLNDDQEFEERSVAVTFDRPYDRDFGAADFIDGELPAIAAAERSGLRLNYATDLDLATHPEVLDGAVGVAFLGHSEYWSRDMRAAATAARDAGTNLAFLGANDVHRRIRIGDTPLGTGRMFVNYKLGTDDPVKTADTTADWGKQPYPDPQSSLIGSMFRCSRGRADLVVSDPNAWIFAGLDVTAGTKLVGVVGLEFDRLILPVPTPRPMQVLAHSPVTCRGTDPDWSDVTWYTTPGGAGVFAAGTLDWIRSMNSPDARTRSVITQATERVLKMMAVPRAGSTQPAVDNVDRYYAADGTPLG